MEPEKKGTVGIGNKEILLKLIRIFNVTAR
jgi:hypothetical protein